MPGRRSAAKLLTRDEAGALLQTWRSCWNCQESPRENRMTLETQTVPARFPRQFGAEHAGIAMPYVLTGSYEIARPKRQASASNVFVGVASLVCLVSGSHRD
jgi:hypothetical protein